MKGFVSILAAACLVVLALTACTQAQTAPAAGTGASPSSGAATEASGAASAQAATSAAGSSSSTAAATDDKKSPATLAKFKKIKKGMSYEQVVAILGVPHVTIGKKTSGDITVALYGWYGTDQFATLVVSLTNGKVGSMSQSGLK
jgi:outer membrane protein assembly factor BamE (lipoprotein component of BamABCDE complex)